MFRSALSPLQRPPSLIPFPEIPTDTPPLMSFDFIDYDGIFSVLQCLATNLPFVVVTAVTLEDGWSPKVMISRGARFETVTWPIAVQQAAPLSLIVSTPSTPRSRPSRIVVRTLQGERHFLRLDLWERKYPKPEDPGSEVSETPEA